MPPRCATGRAGCCTARNSAAARSWPRPICSPASRSMPAPSAASGPSACTLNVDARGGTFTQRWQVFSESWVDAARQCSSTGRATCGSTARRRAVVAVDGVPSAAAAARHLRGRRPLRMEHAARSRCRWPICTAHGGSERGRPARRAARAPGRRACGWASAAAPSSRRRMEVQVYRLVRDEIPAYLLTRIRLNVSGDAREELLGTRAARGLHAADAHGRSAGAPRARRHAARAGARRLRTRSR